MYIKCKRNLYSRLQWRNQSYFYLQGVKAKESNHVTGKNEQFGTKVGWGKPNLMEKNYEQISLLFIKIFNMKLVSRIWFRIDTKCKKYMKWLAKIGLQLIFWRISRLMTSEQKNENLMLCNGYPSKSHFTVIYKT